MTDEVKQPLRACSMSKKPYTIFGYYSDGEQPFVFHVELASKAPDEDELAAAITEKLEEPFVGMVCIVDAVEGHVKGCFESDTMIFLMVGEDDDEYEDEPARRDGSVFG